MLNSALKPTMFAVGHRNGGMGKEFMAYRVKQAIKVQKMLS